MFSNEIFIAFWLENFEKALYNLRISRKFYAVKLDDCNFGKQKSVPVSKQDEIAVFRLLI